MRRISHALKEFVDEVNRRAITVRGRQLTPTQVSDLQDSAGSSIRRTPELPMPVVRRQKHSDDQSPRTAQRDEPLRREGSLLVSEFSGPGGCTYPSKAFGGRGRRHPQDCLTLVGIKP
jgi:hypothetical protein